MNSKENGNQKAGPSEIQKHLGGLKYPTNKKNMVAYAKQHGANMIVIEILEMLPEKQYGSPTDISREIGKAE